jgi:hypothetical protein
MYDAPRIKVVSFTIEQGFGNSIEQSRRQDGLISFGGDVEHGLMNTGHTNGDHSGLGQYGNGGNIFGESL